MKRIFLSIGASCLLLTACGGSGGGNKSPPAPPPPPPPAVCNDSIEFCSAIPGTADPCADSQYWPLNTVSALRPVTVHYPRLADEPKALEMIGLLEDSWSVQIDALGFTAPIDDQGQCGPDGNFDVFIWRGIDGAYVADVSTNPATPYDDYSTFMAIDIDGQTGGRFLASYLAHEFNHALQASDDWWEDSQYYESGATFAEFLVFPAVDDYVFSFEDFQDNPDWSIFFNDSFATWYMYGASMYLHFLSERYFANDPAFYARIWRATRSVPSGQRPDYIDALRAVLLTDRGVTLDDTVIEFMHWRWFVGQFDDGAHFSKGADWPHSVPFTDIDISTLPVNLPVDAMIYGANYFRFSNNGVAPVNVNATLQQSDADVNWKIYSVDGAEVTAPLSIPASGAVVIVALVLPVNEIWADTLSFADRMANLSLVVVP